ncbi:pLS20_p028 family conjugation system transmembrane protein [Dolosigranulum pigrum]|uniref:pLS20_p028 family conjugation system transmembrane protein n=1 Tax=Dolosigranulum pigrum TaxID=29394 RepID=UPI001AD872AC|nr:hypothetical protein [Dolosigranulum pigrum]QTJ45617.1 hypothetical protein FE328_08795 [Dolosigranulum pigrum]
MKMTAAIKQFERWGDENRRLVSILILVSAFFVILYGINQLTESVVVYANDNPNAIAAEENIDNFGLIGEIFRKHDKYLSLRTLIKDVFRVMWWWLIKLVYILVSGLESLLESVLTFYGFIEQLKEHNFYTNLLSIVIASLTAATLAWIGLKMILNHGNPPRIKSVGINLAISFLMIIGLPTMMAWGQEFVEIVWSTDPSSEETQISLQVVKDNVYDMRIPFDVEGNAEEKIESLNRFLDPEQTQPSERNGINERETLDMIEELEYFPIDEVADIFPGSKDDNILLRSKVTTVLDENGDYTLEAQEVDGPGFIAGLIGVVEDLVDTGYYRYHWNGWRIILTLLALGLAFLFVLFSMAKIYIELGFKLFLAPIVFATDLETGQKTKKVFSDLIISFLTLAFEMISFRMFTVFFSFIGEFSDNFFLYIVGLVAGVIVLMEGSKTLLRWFGVDTGLQEGRGMFGTLIRWSGARALTEKAAGFARKATGSSSHSSNKDSSRSSRENLSENREENLDINKDKEESGLVRDIARKTDKAAKGLSKAAGYGKERGLSGLARDTADLGRDTVSAVGDYAKDKYTLARDAISNGIGAIQNSYSSGQTSAQDKGLEELNEAVEESANVLVGDIPETSEAYQGTLSEVSEQQQSSTGSQHQETASSVETDERERQVNVREQENVESGQISDEEALHQIRSQTEDINLSDPEDATRQIAHLVNDSNLSDEQKQTVTQELQKAADMIPPEAEQRINQVLASAVTMMATQSSEQATSSSPQVRDEVKQIRENVQEATFSDPQDDIRRISEQVEQSNLSTEQKQQITQNLQKAADMQPQQAQQHVQQVMNKAQAQMDTPQETVQRLRQETQQATFENPQDAVRQVTEQINSSNMSQDQKQIVTQELQQAANMQPQQAQQHVQQVMNKVQAQMDTPQETVQRLRQETQQATFENPQDAVRQVTEQVNSSNMSQDQKQSVTQELQQAANMQPQQAQQHIQQVMNKAQAQMDTPQETVQRLRQETQQATFENPQNAVRQVTEQINSSNMSQDQKQIVTQELQQAASMQPQQAQQHVQQVLQQVGGQPTAQNETVQQTVQRQATEQSTQAETVQQNVQRQQSSIGGQTENVQQIVQRYQAGSGGQTVQQTPPSVANVSSVSAGAMKSISQSTRQTANMSGGTVQDKAQTIQQNIVKSSQTPEAVEQSVRQVVQNSGISLLQNEQQELTQRVRTIREEANQQNLSDDVVKQRVQKEMSTTFGSSSTQPEYQQVIQQVQEASVGNTVGTQRLSQGVQQATQATQSQAKRNINEVVTRSFRDSGAVMPKSVQQNVKRLLQDAPSNQSPEDLVQHVSQQVQQLDFKGKDEVKRVIMKEIQSASEANPQQFQSNMKRLKKSESERSDE